MSVSSLYTYLPLRHDEIRVLSFRRALNGTDYADPSSILLGPSCIGLDHVIQIDRVILHKDIPSIALSYSWGSGIRDSRLLLRDGSFIPITKSVAEALPCVLRDVEDGQLWIDQICINQGDVQEKNAQVAKMGDIYRSASRVIVWLGPEGNGAERAHQIFRDYKNSLAGSADETHAGLLEAFTSSSEAPLNRQAMISIMKLPWFERAWVVQEFIFAGHPIFVHGSFRWNPDIVFLVTCAFRDLGREPLCQFLDSEISYLRKNHPFQVMHNIKEEPEAFYSLLSRMTGICKSSEVKDLVYAFLSLNNDDRIQISPDYSLTEEGVFTDVARTIITATENLDILAVVPRQSNHASRYSVKLPAEFPSWVPNWCHGPLSVPLFYRAGSLPFEACPGWSWKPKVESKNPDLLELQGRIIGHVHAVSPVLSGTGSRQPLKNFLKLDEQLDALGQILKQMTSRLTLTREQVLRVCISDGSFVPHLSQPTVIQDSKFRQSGPLSANHLKRLLTVYDDESRFDTWDREKWLLREYVLVLRNRRLFVTGDSRIGLAQSSVRTGDTIIIAHGSATPLIIRLVDKSLQRFQFIGQCYLEDAMFGEECDFEKWTVSTFNLV